jgi:hypothetical protein
MSLDLTVQSRAKPGHEAEWLRILQKSFAGERVSDAERRRFDEIGIPGYADIGAPRVGFDAAADAWLFELRGALTSAAQDALRQEFHGCHAVALVACDGIPRCSNAALGYVDETSFRGAFLDLCADVVDAPLRTEAWSHKMPDAAIVFGQQLLAAAEAAASSNPRTAKLALRDGSRRAADAAQISLAEQLEIVRAAGRWYIFWGERGHPIYADF